MSSTPIPEPKTPAALAAELRALRVRAEHGLLTQLVDRLDRQALAPTELAEALRAVAEINRS